MKPHELRTELMIRLQQTYPASFDRLVAFDDDQTDAAGTTIEAVVTTGKKNGVRYTVHVGCDIANGPSDLAWASVTAEKDGKGQLQTIKPEQSEALLSHLLGPRK